jgi:hypothetical protein
MDSEIIRNQPLLSGTIAIENGIHLEMHVGSSPSSLVRSKAAILSSYI